MEKIYLAIAFTPLIGAIVAGFFGAKIGREGAHWVTSVGVGISALLSIVVLFGFIFDTRETFNGSLYVWMVSDGIKFEIGFLVDHLTALMMTVVTFVSFCVHIYTIGYMEHDEMNWPEGSKAGTNSYQRFFSYISLFTFSMLMLVMSNNFLQLFFGWEAVGLVSYLLIGFWSVRETAVFANMKAFLVNRVGDFGFLLGIAAVAMYFNSVDYVEVFNMAPQLADTQINIWGDASWSLMTVICILLFIGAMGKSAQAPLHVWLPDSMEGPTPISALIHAATMVTAGIFMVARMSPLYELSETALSFILIVGASTAFFTGLIGLVQNDIKRVVAYSTLSQLGYMTVALGASAYAASIFHLMTHAFFKALLFLAAGSVIIGMHHVQDMRKMGGLKKYMPITYWTSLIGTLALIGFPGFSGFFSKDAVIEAVHHSNIYGSGFAYWMVLLGVFVTALYSFRMFFMVFHGEERMDDHTKHHLRESPKTVTVPLIMLAVPSVIIGAMTVGGVAFGGWFDGAITVAPQHDVLGQVGYNGVLGFMWHGIWAPPTWLALFGFLTAYVLYIKKPELADKIKQAASPIHNLLDKKYFFDEAYQFVFAGGSKLLGKIFWKVGDQFMIDGLVVNGSARTVGFIAGIVRHIQTGYLYHYAFAMILGLLLLLALFVN
ncbi:NADH-ubiquinone oxidoreductase chain L [hydrothermal vent metagenome]|uniref:NADH-ubiquinone oxidoreductase chain L n=1 Tax=hydrothermal vent metagenome TaxID=652676 RepID=A0A3B1BZA9_9ZZZZ